MESQLTDGNSQAPDLKSDVRPTPYSSALGLTKAYASDWESSHAFRELYQNWKDAIIESHNLGLLEFNPQITNTEKETLIAVYKHTETADDRVAGQTLGYIKFDKGVGVVEFANFGTVITPRSLELGYTTKLADPRLAGRYGDGLKIAALVLCRYDYHVRIASNSCYWNFGFKGRCKNEFYYQLYPAGPDRVRKLKAADEANRQRGKLRKMTANIWEDVSVSVGRIRDHGKPVTAEVFLDWMKITIDLNPPSVMVRTPSGNLILDQEFAGHLYIKGIRVDLTDSKRAHYRFGYDFLSGSLNANRDRRLEANPDEEARAVASIWEEAIMRQEEMVLTQYKELLQRHPSCADVALADTVLTEDTARKLWAVLAKDAQVAGTFYYPEGFADDNVHLIHYELKCEPAALPDRLWRLFRKFGLVRLPFEEIYCRFRLSKVIEPPATLYAREINRALSALLSAHPTSQGTRIVYVQCDDYRPNVVYLKERRTLYIHEKWLNFWRAHSSAPCEVSEVCQQDPAEFFCEHLVEDLYKRAMLAIFQPSREHQLSLKDAHALQMLFRESKEKIREMPTMIQLSRGNGIGSLRVSWNDSYSRAFSKEYGTRVKYFVILHGTACYAEKQKLWYHQKDDISCDCPHKFVPQATNSAVFEGLDGEPRFPMVARFRDHAIYGHPPDPMSPKSGPPVNATASDLTCALSSGPESEGSDPYSPVLSVSSQYGASPLGTEEDRADPHTPSASNEGPVELELNGRSSSRSNPTSPDREEELVAEMHTLYDAYSQLGRAWEGQVSTDVRTLLNMLQAEERKTAKVPDHPAVMQYQGFRKGQYIEATLAGEGGGPRVIFYIHDVWEPRENDPAQLLVTRYSFMLNFPAFATTDAGSLDDHELLLHFTDAEHMGERGDGEVYTVADIVPIRADFTVHHVSQKPAPVVEYYCRYAIQTRDDSDSCYLSSFRRSFPNSVDDRHILAFSPLPVPSIIDVSPGDPGVSAGFIRAGCRIHRGVFYDQEHHSIWKQQNPTAETFGSIQEGLNISSQAIDLRNCRVVTISRGMSWTPSTSESDSDSQAGPFYHCRLVAEHEQHPDFIFFNLPLAGWSPFSSKELIKTILTLLSQQYSVHIRLQKTPDNEIEEGRPVFFLLAAPHYTNPVWINNTLGDLSNRKYQNMAASGGKLNILASLAVGFDLFSCLVVDDVKNPKNIAALRGFSEEISDFIGLHDYPQILDALPPSFACQIATVICTICGRIALQNQHQMIEKKAMIPNKPHSKPEGRSKKPKLFIQT